MKENIIYGSECFLNEGLKLNAFKISNESLDACLYCIGYENFDKFNPGEEFKPLQEFH